MADKLIIHLTPFANPLGVQDTDRYEVQTPGEAFTRQATGSQARQVEKTAREAQDNVIEASCGLQTDGTYLPEADSWYLRAADFAAGVTDRGGASGALTANIQNALRLLDARINSMGSGNYVILRANLNADTTLTGIVPAGYMLTYVVFLEKAGSTPILDLGTTPGGNEVFINQEITASVLTTIVIQRVFSLSAATTLYLNDDDAGSTWDGSTVDAYFVMTPIIPGGGGGIVVVGYYEGAYALSGPPTEAEIIAIIGDPTDYAPGSLFIINDTATVLIYFYLSNGTNWYYNTSSFAELV